MSESVASAAPDLSGAALGGPLDAALRYATVVTHHVLEQAMRTSLRAYRFARAANTS